ncbi:TniQ family protein [Cereibacter sp. SYSU M97828]|nr:TniQ family protein [Cereibacter flavus]
MVFPPPFLRETLPSYGYRIAQISGVNSLRELAYLFDLDLPAFLKGDPLSLEGFASYVGHSSRVLAQGSVNAESIHRLQVGPNKQNEVRCSTGSYRFCPKCVEGLETDDHRSFCLGRTEWLVDAVHVCPIHCVRLMTATPEKTGRVQADLSLLIPKMVAALTAATPPTAEPTTLERYIIGRLDGTATHGWIDNLQLDVVIHTAEVFGAMELRGQHSSWSDIGSEERRQHGAAGADVLIEGPSAIMEFLKKHIGMGARGDDYHATFGNAFSHFYARRLNVVYHPVCAILARYVGANFRFTGQEMVFGIRTMGKRPTTLRSLCEQHNVGMKITAQVLEAQYGIRAGSSTVVDPQLIDEIAPQLKGLMNSRDAARDLGVGVELLKGLVDAELLVPDFRFNDRMLGFKRDTLDAFKMEWCEGVEREAGIRFSSKTPIYVASCAYGIRVPQLLIAIREHGIDLYRGGATRELRHMKIRNMDLWEMMRSINAG